MDKNNFNNFFEENDIIIENKELIDSEEQYVQDDLVYEIDVYNSRDRQDAKSRLAQVHASTGWRKQPVDNSYASCDNTVLACRYLSQ